MANYCCAVRTNYFHVKDENRFKEFMSRACGCEDTVEVWEETAPNGDKLFGFGCYGGIAGLCETNDIEEDDECSYDEFIDGLQKCVADNDAIIIFETGNEKLRYLVGVAEIITASDYKLLDLQDLAVSEAAKRVPLIGWKTRCED